MGFLVFGGRFDLFSGKSFACYASGPSKPPTRV
jgi:hypothetical protein